MFDTFMRRNMLLQGRKQMKITGCQGWTVWGMVRDFPIEIFRKFQVCCAMCSHAL
jgi:hypothetical protein